MQKWTFMEGIFLKKEAKCMHVLSIRICPRDQRAYLISTILDNRCPRPVCSPWYKIIARDDHRDQGRCPCHPWNLHFAIHFLIAQSAVRQRQHTNRDNVYGMNIFSKLTIWRSLSAILRPHAATMPPLHWPRTPFVLAPDRNTSETSQNNRGLLETHL